MATLVLFGHDLSGTTAALPTDAEAGQPYFNQTTGQWLVFNGTAWQGMRIVPTPASDINISPLLNATGNAGDITGGDDTFLILTARGPNNFYTTRTAAQLFSDIPGNVVGFSYALTIVNAGNGVVTFQPGSEVTINSPLGVPVPNYTIVAGFYRQFNVTFITASTATIQSVVGGPYN